MSKSNSQKLIGKSRFISSVHDILLPGVKLIKLLEKTDLPINRIIPQHISVSPDTSGGARITLSKNTATGIKINISMGNARQSMRILCSAEDAGLVRTRIGEIIEGIN